MAIIIIKYMSNMKNILPVKIIINKNNSITFLWSSYVFIDI